MGTELDRLNLSCESNAFQAINAQIEAKRRELEVLISLARVMLFRFPYFSLLANFIGCLNLSCESNAFQEYPSGSRINKGLQRAVLNNCTEKHLLEFVFLFTKP